MIEIAFIFLCVIVIVLLFESEQLRVQREISKKCFYYRKDILQKNLFFPKASN